MHSSFFNQSISKRKCSFYLKFEFISFWIQGVLERLEWKYTMVAKSILSCFSTCLDWAFFSFRHIQTCFIWCANKFYTSCISTNFCQIGHRQIQERHPDISFWNFPTTSQVLISPFSDLPAFPNKSFKKQKIILIRHHPPAIGIIICLVYIWCKIGNTFGKKQSAMGHFPAVLL